MFQSDFIPVYDRLWTKTERLLEMLLDRHCAALESASQTQAPVPVAPAKRKKRSLSKPSILSTSSTPSISFTPPSPSSGPSPPSFETVRTLYTLVQSLRYIQQGRLALFAGGNHDVQSLGSDSTAKTAAEDVSRRIQQLCQSGGENGNDEDPL